LRDNRDSMAAHSEMDPEERVADGIIAWLREDEARRNCRIDEMFHANDDPRSLFPLEILSRRRRAFFRKRSLSPVLAGARVRNEAF